MWTNITFLILFCALFSHFSSGQSGCQTSYSNIAISGNELANISDSSSSCCQHCQQQAGCLAYTWNSTNGGTCWLKSDTQPLYKSNGAFTVMMSPSGENIYQLSVDYNASNIFDDFYFQLKNRDCGCFVNYTDKDTATKNGQIGIKNGKIYMAVDNTTVLPPNSTTGRNSINIASKHTFSAGLWIFSVEHLPLGPGLWPAYWSYGYHWPYDGEIDIFETFYVNSSLMNYNTMTLHTGYNSSVHCVMPTDAQKFSTGFYLRNDCDSNGTHDSGCGVAAPPGTYNVGFNQAGGGVFAMEWDPERKFIRGWNFVKPNIPSDILNNSPNPNPETWGMPMAYFPLGDNCTTDHFRNHTIVMDMAFCGGAANYIFPGGVNGCIDVARNQPSAYSEAYWLFDYIKVFCKPGQNCIVQ